MSTVRRTLVYHSHLWMGVVYPHRSKSSLVETKECIHSSMDSKHIKMTFRTITNEVNKNT